MALSNIKDKAVEVMVWNDAILQGGTEKKPTVQRELHPETMTIEALVSRIKIQIDIFLPHYQAICWMRHFMYPSNVSSNKSLDSEEGICQFAFLGETLELLWSLSMGVAPFVLLVCLQYLPVVLHPSTPLLPLLYLLC